MTRKAVKPKMPTMNELAGKLWKALESAEELLAHEDPAVRLKAIGAIGAIGSAYAKVYPARERRGNPFAADFDPLELLESP